MKIKYLIIGAGPSGLGAGHRLKERGVTDFLIVDAEKTVGGLSKSFVDENGFTWDIGGHIQFSHYAYFDRLMDAAIPAPEWENHERESWVWLANRFVPYPFQNNIRFLPWGKMLTCLFGIIRLKIHRKFSKTPPSANFLDWIQNNFGDGIGRLFMEPYNFKVWAIPPVKMSSEWVGDRVSVVSLRKTLRNILLRKNDVSWGPNNRFRFPKKGGTGAIWESVADLVGRKKIRLNSAVKAVDPVNHFVILEDGTKIEYEALFNTMPVDQLIERCRGLESLHEIAAKLQHSTTHIVGIGLRGQTPAHLKGKCWLYFPESNCPFYRVTVFSHYSKLNVPDPKTQWSLMLEISESQYKPVDQKNIVQDAIAGLLATQLIGSRDDIVSRFYHRAPYGYPTPTVERNESLKMIQPCLEEYQIYSRGRFGGWKYEVSNQDHSVMQGVEWAERMTSGLAECTYFDPNRVNAGKSDWITTVNTKKAA